MKKLLKLLSFLILCYVAFGYQITQIENVTGYCTPVDPQLSLSVNSMSINAAINSNVSTQATSVLNITNGANKIVNITVTSRGDWLGIPNITIAQNDGSGEISQLLSLTSGSSCTLYSKQVTDSKTVNLNFSFPADAKPTTAGKFEDTGCKLIFNASYQS